MICRTMDYSYDANLNWSDLEMINIEPANLIMTMFSTAIGAIIGGLVTLIVNKKFEITRIRINNINDMKNDVTPALQRYVRVLKSAGSFFLSSEDNIEQDKIIAELDDALALLNEKVDTYEIELSNMLDFTNYYSKKVSLSSKN